MIAELFGMMRMALLFALVCGIMAAFGLSAAFDFALAFLGWAAVFFAGGKTLGIMRRRRESQ